MRRVLQERTIIHQNRHTDNYSQALKIKPSQENKKLKLLLDSQDLERLCKGENLEKCPQAWAERASGTRRTIQEPEYKM